MAAESAPIAVTDPDPDATLGYFVSAAEFERFLQLWDFLQTARYAWETPDEIAAALRK
jgi:hypothetical protein